MGTVKNTPSARFSTCLTIPARLRLGSATGLKLRLLDGPLRGLTASRAALSKRDIKSHFAFGYVACGSSHMSINRTSGAFLICLSGAGDVFFGLFRRR